MARMYSMEAVSCVKIGIRVRARVRLRIRVGTMERTSSIKTVRYITVRVRFRVVARVRGGVTVRDRLKVRAAWRGCLAWKQ